MPTSATCPRCRRRTATPFDRGGLCLRCAGIRALAIDLEDETEPGRNGRMSAALDAADQSQLPERIGPYEIIDELGRGGMARVFAARQPRLDRLVALKTLAVGPAAHGLEQRFLREIQTIARLRHPHIVAIHDSGRADGYVFFAMDYIEGGDLAQRLRGQAPAPRELAGLMEKIARALAYAHAEGVLHRDLKPSNLLLDGDEPRLADFGLAAQLDPGGDLTMVSAVLGTPHYLAPEVAKHGSGAFTIASDLYALGVILYQALAGRTPFAGASTAELPALLQNAEPPPLRLLAPATPRDLETICLKCLEREPARRYANAGALADDLRRFLAGEPILARPPGAAERFRRFARRQRTLLAVTAGTGAALTLGLVVSTAFAVRARREAARADAAARLAAGEAARAASALRQANAVLAYFRDDVLAQASPDEQPDPDIKLRTVLDRASASVGRRWAEQPDLEAPLREVLGVTYSSAGQYRVAQEHLERALTLARTQYGPDDPRTLMIENALASNLIYLRRNDEAEAAKHRLVEIFRRKLGPQHKATLNVASDLAAVYLYQSKLPEAEALLRDTIADLERTYGPLDRDTLNSRVTLGLVLMRQGRLQDAAVLVEETLRRIRQVSGGESEQVVSTLTTLGGIFGRLGAFDRAAAALEEGVATGTKVLGAEHQTTLNAMNSLAVVYLRQRRLEEAAGLLDRVYRARLEQLGPAHALTLTTEVSLANLHRERGQFEEAIQLYMEVRNRRQVRPGPTHPDTARVTDLLGSTYLDQGKLREALALHREALELRRSALGEQHYETLESVRNVVHDELRLGHAAAAAQVAQAAVPIAEQAQPDTWQTALLHCQLGAALTRLGRFAEAETELRAGAERVLKDPAQIPAVVRQKTLHEVQGYQEELKQARRPAG